ncbi:MAG TPA: hypothetical protein VF516_01175 [Kofleriaceae bacterium]
MSTPVTHGELQDTLGLFQQELRMERQREIQAAIAPLATKADLAPLATRAELHQEIQAAIAPLSTRAELEMWGGALVARIQQGEQRLGNLEHGQQQLIGRLDQLEQRVSEGFQQTEQRFQQLEQRLLDELARHTSAVLESMQTQIKASFEPLADLPGRVRRLETAVFGPKPLDRPTRRRKR